METPSYIYFVIVSILVFNVFGHFGNVNMIILYIKKPNLRTHYGCLLVILCACQSVCLLFELINVYFAIKGYVLGNVIRRTECFEVLFPYVFFNAFQADVVAAIAVDFLLCISFPLRYRNFKRNYYLPCLLVLPLTHGLYIVLFGFRYLDDQPIKLCNPPSALFPAVNTVNYIICLVSAAATLASYVLGYALLYFKSQKRTRIAVERKALRSISVLVVIFLSNRFMAMLFVNLLTLFGASKQLIVITQDVLVIFALICFSQTFYVCYLRSYEYRSMLNSQLSCFVRIVRPDFSSKPTALVAQQSMTDIRRGAFRTQRQTSLQQLNTTFKTFN